VAQKTELHLSWFRAVKINHTDLIHASWVKRDRMNMSLLDAAYADSRDGIQLEAAYKDGTGKGGTGPSLQENQIKLQEIRSVGFNSSDRI